MCVKAKGIHTRIYLYIDVMNEKDSITDESTQITELNHLVTLKCFGCGC